MKSAFLTTAKLLLLYMGIQLLCILIVLFPSGVYTAVTDASFDDIKFAVIGFSMLLASLWMSRYLFKHNYIPRNGKTWSLDRPVSTVSLLLGITFAYALLTDPLSRYIEVSESILEMFEGLSHSFWGIITVCLFVPILEELLFRGAIMRLFMGKTNPVWAIVISALIFGIIHGNAIQIANASLMGLFLGWLYYKTGSLVPSILVHVINNSLSTLVTVFFPEAESIVYLTGPATYWLWVAGGGVLLAGLIWLFNKRPTVAWEQTVSVVDRDLENDIQPINS